MTDWFKQNRWLGTFLIVSGACLILALYFLFSQKSAANEAATRFDEAAVEKNRLEGGNPFPNDTNTRKMKVHVDNFAAALDKLKEELKSHVLPATPMAPNEFQSRLRQAMTATGEKARANKVKLPDNFALGFEVYTTALPGTEAAPLLGQELAQAELLMNILVEARVDGVATMTRLPLPEERAASATPTPAPAGAKKPAAPAAPAGSKVIERNVVDLTFTASPGALRRVLNQVTNSPQQFYIIRTLHVRNEKEKGPPREQAAAQATPAPTPATPAAGATGAAGKPGANAALTFIVGNEHVETTARIEMVRFNY